MAVNKLFIACPSSWENCGLTLLRILSLFCSDVVDVAAPIMMKLNTI